MHPFRRQPTLLIAVLTLLGAQGALADKPAFHSHHQGTNGEEQDHYKDSGEKPPQARVGRTLFTSRALLGKNGVTELEVTTGTLDSGSVPPGYLSELHVKAFRLDGTHQFEKEFEHLRSGGGYAKFSFPLPVSSKGRGDDDREQAKKDTHLEHGQLLKLKVEGKGILSDRDGEAEAKLENTVKYRPDPALTSLQYPATAKPRTDVDVSATMMELMGDTGSHSDCVLSVDGAAVDTVPGVWLDASGVVTCHFRTRFTVTGQHTLSVAVQNVLPGDYDGDNNSLSGTIKIENPAVMSFNASVAEQTATTYNSRDIYPANDPTTLIKRDATTRVQHTQTRLFTGDIPASVSLPLNKATYADQSDGNQLSSITFSGLSADSVSPSTNSAYDTDSVINRFDSQSGGFFTLTTSSSASTGAGLTHVSWYFPGGEVTYHSLNYCQGAAGYACNGGDYTYNKTWTVAISGMTAPIVSLGKTFGADVLVDDGNSYQAHPRMDLGSQSQPAPSFPASCRGPITLNGALVNICMQSSSSSVTTTGTAAFLAPSM